MCSVFTSSTLKTRFIRFFFRIIYIIEGVSFFNNQIYNMSMRQFKCSQHITGRSTVSVNNYLRDVNRYPMATLEEEVQLAQAIRKGGKEGERAKRRLVEANLRYGVGGPHLRR